MWAGRFVYLPKGVPHSFIAGRIGANVFTVVTPGGLEGFFEEVGVPAAELRLHDLPPDVAKSLRLSHGYGIEVVGPPMRPEG